MFIKLFGETVRTSGNKWQREWRCNVAEYVRINVKQNARIYAKEHVRVDHVHKAGMHATNIHKSCHNISAKMSEQMPKNMSEYICGHHRF